MQLKRFNKVRSKKTSSRFEGVLATVRRAPVFPGREFAYRKESTVGFSPVTKTPFFRRSYSTATQTCSPDRATLVAELISLRQRQTAASEEGLADSTAIVLHRSVKERAYSRELTAYAPATIELGAGSIDLRLVRSKSIRNSQYLLRQNYVNTTSNTFYNKQRLKLHRNRQLFAKYGATIPRIYYAPRFRRAG
jgi:hypothetical protein